MITNDDFNLIKYLLFFIFILFIFIFIYLIYLFDIIAGPNEYEKKKDCLVKSATE